MIVIVLVLIAIFVLTWFATLPPPFFIILCIIEGIALFIAVVPYAPLRAPLF